MHPLIQTMLLTALVPSLVAGFFALAASWVPPGRWRSGLVAAGLAVAWCAGSWLAVRAPRWPAMQAADWQFYAVASAGVIALITPFLNLKRAWSWLAGFVFFAVFFALLLQRMLAGLWPGPGALVWPLGLAALALINAGAVSRVGHSVQAAWTFFALLVFSVFSSALLTLSGAVSLGHSAGLLASACGGVWLVSWALRRQVDLGLAAFVSSIILGGLLVQGLFFGGLPWPAALVMGVAWPAAAVLSFLTRHGAGVWRAAVATVLIAVAGGVALLIAGR
jgi:hypothetical protein